MPLTKILGFQNLLLGPSVHFLVKYCSSKEPPPCCCPLPSPLHLIRFLTLPLPQVRCEHLACLQSESWYIDLARIALLLIFPLSNFPSIDHPPQHPILFLGCKSPLPLPYSELSLVSPPYTPITVVPAPVVITTLE